MTPEQRAFEFKNKFPNPLEVCEEIIKVLDAFGYQGTMWDDFETGQIKTSDDEDPEWYWKRVKEYLK